MLITSLAKFYHGELNYIVDVIMWLKFAKLFEISMRNFCGIYTREIIIISIL